MGRQRGRERFDPSHVWRLDIDPKRGRRFWMVAIYETEDEMNAWLRALPGGEDDPYRYLACCVPMTRADIPEFQGYLVFSKEHLGAGIVAHEMVHAVCNHMKTDRSPLTRGNGRLVRSREERFALLVEGLVTQFWVKWYRYGSLPTKLGPA